MHDAVCKEFRLWNSVLYFLEALLRTGVSNLCWMRLQDTFLSLDAVPQATDLDSVKKLTLECDPDKLTIAMALNWRRAIRSVNLHTNIPGRLEQGDQIVNSRTAEMGESEEWSACIPMTEKIQIMQKPVISLLW